MTSVQDLHDELDYWLFIGIADDIIKMPAHRPEYTHLVNRYKHLGSRRAPRMVLRRLKWELTLPAVLRPTQYHLIKVWVMRKLFG